ncbi:MAG: hypothetical protein IJC56_05365 [Clostridia bacterium]|nr:hypothetical protein [Clostridia bacterium]
MKRYIAILISICLFQYIPISALGDTQGISLDDIEITVNGVPIEELIGTAAGMFSDAFEENMMEVLDGLNEVFGEFADDMSGDLDEIEMILGSMIDDTWSLNMPAVSFDTMIKRSAYESALDLYMAQLDGNTDKGSKFAQKSTEASGNDIIYIYDDGNLIPEILKAVYDGSLGENDIRFGSDDCDRTYKVSAVLYLAPSDEPFAMCNMTDLSDERHFEAFRDYIYENAVMNYDVPFEYEDQILTLIFWNGDEDSDWLAVVAKEAAIAQNVRIASFIYRHTGSVTSEIYSYEVTRDAESGEMRVFYDLNCGYETYTLPADEELMRQLEELVVAHNLSRWNGFDETNSRVLDGTGFKLGICFDDGSEITALGSNRFPNGYSDASNAIDALFRGYMEKGE